MESSLERIVVPLDGSDESAAALDALAPIAGAWGPEVYLLGITEPETTSRWMEDRLEKAAIHLRGMGVEASTAIREGSPAEEILKYVRHEKIGLVAMSTHGRGGLKRLFLGSVTEEVLRKAEVPVLVCRPGATQGNLKRLVVALDGSERAEEILPHATAMAKKHNATLDLVRVVFPSVSPLGLGEIPIYIPAEDPLPYLQELSGRLQAEGVPCVTTKLEGRAASEILDHVAATGAGLLCMTTHGRNGAARILLGSIAEEVLRHSPCPVLLRRMTPARNPAVKAGGRP